MPQSNLRESGRLWSRPMAENKGPCSFPSESGAQNVEPSFSVYRFTCKGQFRKLTQLIPNHCGAKRILRGCETSI